MEALKEDAKDGLPDGTDTNNPYTAAVLQFIILIGTILSPVGIRSNHRKRAANPLFRSNKRVPMRSLERDCSQGELDDWLDPESRIKIWLINLLVHNIPCSCNLKPSTCDGSCFRARPTRSRE